ncbi:hypothetical protein CBR_g23075 [Chara braunii]|uniref:Integrase catalytic domain-containing protein n=1 Tax=Chara braunii TaxID=69332 RepID=A0A388L3I4_CHABU|nr:hypothetical protein CBR_g23075 [Chara braunii]|eukprot:GBG76860.1 hypothetical protein CBR_g23075 [Chara braunii]
MHQDTEEILTDHGAEFRGEVLRNLVIHDVAIQNTAPHMSQSNGLVENANRLINDLPLNIISQCDEIPVPHVLLWRLTPYLQWSACLEERGGGGSYPSRSKYLNPRGIIDILFFHPWAVSEDEAIAVEEEEEEDEEEETPEEGSYSEQNEEKPGSEEEEEEEEDREEEEEGSEWESLGEEVDRAEVQEEDYEVVVWQREEIAVGKQSLEYASGADLPIPDDPTKDPEPPRIDDEDTAVETSSAPARRRRS